MDFSTSLVNLGLESVPGVGDYGGSRLLVSAAAWIVQQRAAIGEPRPGRDSVEPLLAFSRSSGTYYAAVNSNSISPHKT
jgi:hypothetical protein